jgi:prevent-host-death family protein
MPVIFAMGCGVDLICPRQAWQTKPSQTQERIMQTVNIHEAKTHLSRLLEQVANGDEVIIAKAGKPIARLAPLDAAPKKRRLGLLKGKLQVPDDFDAPLTDAELALFGCPTPPK